MIKFLLCVVELLKYARLRPDANLSNEANYVPAQKIRRERQVCNARPAGPPNRGATQIKKAQNGA